MSTTLTTPVVMELWPLGGPEDSVSAADPQLLWPQRLQAPPHVQVRVGRAQPDSQLAHTGYPPVSFLIFLFVMIIQIMKFNDIRYNAKLVWTLPAL